MTGTKTIRALSRGLEVLRLLESGGTATLHELAGRTGLPKATLLRVLATLEKEGYVRRGIGDQLYHHTIRSVSPASDDWGSVLAEVAAPILDRLCNAVLWPSDLGTYGNGAIHIQETTRRLSPFVLNRDVLLADIHVMPSAMGRAVLAWSSAERREAIIGRLIARGRRPDAQAKNRDAVASLIHDTVKKGYACRLHGYFISHRREGRLSAIARPILAKGEAVGAVNLAWVGSALSEQEFVARYLTQLNDAAADIGRSFEQRFDGAVPIDH